ncbi:MAG TPA: Uma2 family endonuclease [Pyrinomonadaceae bacterium]|jgi:Uma2 family endonuclease|nr:Uma2 family endonuclease [Pyrinomonadaceae bacterium]
MSATLTTTEREPLVLRFSPRLKQMSDHEFYEFCQLNRDLRLELTSEGDLIIMPPTGSKTGIRNSRLHLRLAGWAEKDGTGQAFDSSAGFTLPNSAKRSPDFAWVNNERWNALTEEEQEEFAPLCPDFVVELRSRTDILANIQRKMDEYMANGALLGWLIDPQERQVYVYRSGAAVEKLENPQTISGEPLLRGLVLNLQEIWD